MQERDELVNVINSLPSRTKKNIKRRFFKANQSLDLSNFRSIQHYENSVAVVENDFENDAQLAQQAENLMEGQMDLPLQHQPEDPDRNPMPDINEGKRSL